VIHRDLKPENILLESNKDFTQIKIIDFGISLRQEPTQSVTESIGTPYYIAPEVWKKHYNRECDVWSAGVIMYILLSGTPPFNAPTDKEMKEKILEGAYNLTGPTWDATSEAAKDLIGQLLTYDPESRVTAEAALSHVWFEEQASSKKVDARDASAALTNLKNFRAEEKIKQATCAYIAAQLLTKKEKDNLGTVFKALDVNGDGKLSHEEIKNGYGKFFGQIMTDEDVENMFRAVDLDDSGYIDYSEFVIACTSEKNLFNEKKLKAAFKMFDKDDSGYIS
jgi:calcium-dependent protein kinase